MWKIMFRCIVCRNDNIFCGFVISSRLIKRIEGGANCHKDRNNIESFQSKWYVIYQFFIGFLFSLSVLKLVALDQNQNVTYFVSVSLHDSNVNILLSGCGSKRQNIYIYIYICCKISTTSHPGYKKKALNVEWIAV